MSAQGAGPYSIGSDVWPGLSKVVEGAGELQQVLGKLVGSSGNPEHFDGTDLTERMMEEIGDLYAALDYFIEANWLSLVEDVVDMRRHHKCNLFWRWHNEARGATA